MGRRVVSLELVGGAALRRSQTEDYSRERGTVRFRRAVESTNAELLALLRYSRAPCIDKVELGFNTLH
jgi:hypothetical protein